MAKKNTRKQQYEERTEALVTPITEPLGIWVYDVEFVKEGSDYYLNVYIDKEDGVNIGDCETVSRALSDELDREDFIAEEYTLVVSSPGLGRTLTRDRHFANSIGEEVEIRTFRPNPDTGSKEFTGYLKDFDADTLTIAYTPAPSKKKKGSQEEDPGERDIKVVRKDIALVRLTIDF